MNFDQFDINYYLDAASVSSLSLDSLLEVSYETQCQSEPLRHTKHSKVVGMVVCQSTECQIALMMNDGRILVLDLVNQQQVALPSRSFFSKPGLIPFLPKEHVNCS